MTQKQIDEIKARCEAATPGEWEYQAEGDGEFVSYYTEPSNGFVRELPFITVGVDTPEETGNDEPFYYVEVSEADAEFIAHAREDIPLLLDYIKELKKDNALRQAHEEQAVREAIRVEKENAELRARHDKAVELPCKIGNKVYLSTIQKYIIIEEYSLSKCNDYNNLYYHCRCSEHEKNAKGNKNAIEVCPRCAFGDKCFQGFNLNDFGKTVFFTREEAEKALKERESND